MIDLNFTTILAKFKQFQPSAFIYLTFDDGPNIGTNFVLDVLKAEEVRAGMSNWRPAGRMWPLCLNCAARRVVII